MKKLVLLFAAVVLAGTAAFAVEDKVSCTWRRDHGLPMIGTCEYFIQKKHSLPTQKCCWDRDLCANINRPVPTCESFLQNGTDLTGPECCWESRENIANLLNAKGNNGKGGKKTHVQSPKNKKGKTTKVQTSTKKVTAKK